MTNTSYYNWTSREISVNGQSFAVQSKPGLFAHGESDAASLLLAETLEVEPDQRVLNLNCGNGLVGLVAGRTTGQPVMLTDRNIVAVEAARRNAAANSLPNIAVRHTNKIMADPPPDVIAVRLPKEKPLALQYLWDSFRALPIGGRLYLAGANDDGIKSYLRHVEELFGAVEMLGLRKSCRVGLAVKPMSPPLTPQSFSELPDERFHELAISVRGLELAVYSKAGVFAWDRLDEGTQVLVETMQVKPSDTVLDLGCGNGIIGTVAAKFAPQGHAYLLDADIDAVEAATRTVAANSLANATVLASDCAEAVQDKTFDVVVTNPPFHLGRATEYDIAGQFILDAARLLRRKGTLYLVANRFLPYDRQIQAAFGNVTTAFENPRYKVLKAIKP